MILLLHILSLLFVHDIHVTKSRVDYNPEEQSFQVSMHVFVDDLEAVVKEENKFSEKIFLGTEKEIAIGDSLLAVYLSRHFLIETDKDTLNIEYLGKETTEDKMAVWCYFEFPVTNPDAIKSVKLTNNTLMELYSDQQNIVSFKGLDQKATYQLFAKDVDSFTKTY